MSAIQELIEIVARLRGPGGCPWDIEQTHQSLCEALIEETAELLDTIDREDFAHMREELGDVLLQVVFHSQLTAEAGRFDFEAVAREVCAKLVRRHPHVFGDVDLRDSAAVLRQWEKIKEQEKAAHGGNGRPPVFKPLPPRLPALLYAHGVYKQIQRKELIIPDAGATQAAVAALAEGLDAAAAGEQLFRLAAACREAGIDPESALRRHTDKLVAKVEHASRTDQCTIV